MGDGLKLTTMQIDALREVGNIGTGNAVASLAQLLSHRISMSVPFAGVLPLNEVVALVGGEEEVVACTILELTRDTLPGTIIILMDLQSSFFLCDALLGRKTGETSEIDDMVESVIKEVGNILSGSFLGALSTITGLKMVSSVPYLAIDMLGAVLSSALVESGYHDEKVLVIETTLYDAEIIINGHFFLLPTQDSLKRILASLGLSAEGEHNG